MKKFNERAPPSAMPQDIDNLDTLTARERELLEQIKELKDYVENEPERQRQAEEERANTLPPPSLILDRQREDKFMRQLSRGELKNEKRSQVKNSILLVLLLLAILAVGLWIWRTII